MHISLSIRAKTDKGSKKVEWGFNPDIHFTFTSEKVDEWHIQSMPINPGVNILRFSDPLWGMGQNALWVEEIIVKPIETVGKPAP